MCNVCGFEYDGEDFTKEESDYVCPLCDAHKDEFQARDIDNQVCDATDEYHQTIKKR